MSGGAGGAGGISGAAAGTASARTKPSNPAGSVSVQPCLSATATASVEFVGDAPTRSTLAGAVEWRRRVTEDAKPADLRRRCRPAAPYLLPSREREAQPLSHSALRRMAVQALHELAAVRMTVPVCHHVRRQATLHQKCRAGVTRLVELELVALTPPLP